MRFNPDNATNTIPDGEYDAEVAEAEEQTSKKGNAMIKLTVRVWTGTGNPRIVFDYAVDPTTLWRLKQLCAAVGLADRFAAGAVEPSDLKGRSLRVQLKTQKQNGFDDKNVIVRYLAAETANPPAASSKSSADDDMVPF